MITLRRATDRGHANLGWLDSWHTFSFSHYHDPRFMGYRSLRVINDDRIAPGKGFGTHGHEDMEIITYVLSGALEHRDSMGTGSVLRPGDVQRMSAGTGVMHSEFNASATEPVHLLQIWIEPDATGVEPRYDDRHFSREERLDRLRLVSSHDGRDGSLAIHQDADVYAAILQADTVVTHPLKPGRHAWLQLATGTLDVDGTALAPGDGAAIDNHALVTMRSSTGAEFLLFDLA
ncbi:MAG: pirin family protein [Planctomycetes bacterium]|nr:pirin family protein [Planctomycetota bacterium]